LSFLLACPLKPVRNLVAASPAWNVDEHPVHGVTLGGLLKLVPACCSLTTCFPIGL
jgi:hypothetical protein